LMHSVEAGNEAIVKLLLQRGANPRAQDTDALCSAVTDGAFNIADLLFAAGIDPLTECEDLLQTLVDCEDHEPDSEGAAYLVSKGVPIAPLLKPDGLFGGLCDIGRTVYHKEYDLVRDIVKAGANLDDIARASLPALLKRGAAHAVPFFEECGADPNLISNARMVLAAKAGKVAELTQHLSKASAILDPYMDMALMSAVTSKRESVLEVLLAHDVSNGKPQMSDERVDVIELAYEDFKSGYEKLLAHDLYHRLEFLDERLSQLLCLDYWAPDDIVAKIGRTMPLDVVQRLVGQQAARGHTTVVIILMHHVLEANINYVPCAQLQSLLDADPSVREEYQALYDEISIEQSPEPKRKIKSSVEPKAAGKRARASSEVADAENAVNSKGTRTKAARTESQKSTKASSVSASAGTAAAGTKRPVSKKAAAEVAAPRKRVRRG